MKKPTSPFRKKSSVAGDRAAKPAPGGPSRKVPGGGARRPVPPSPAPAIARRPTTPSRRSAKRAAAKLEALAGRLVANVERAGAIVASLRDDGRSPPARELGDLLARVQRDYARALAEKTAVADGERAKRQAEGDRVLKHLASAGVDFTAALELVQRGGSAADVLEALAAGPAAGKLPRKPAARP